MNVEQIMTRNPATCGPEDPCDAAARIMWEQDVGCVPVVDSSNRVVGMITDRDICMAAYTQGRCLRELCVSEAMAKRVLCASPKDSLAKAEETMRDGQIRRMPVTDGGGRLLGILSLNDLAREAIRERGTRRRELGGEEVMTTLAAICEPRASQAMVQAADAE